MKISSKIFAVTAALLLLLTVHGAESEYSRSMQHYQYTMQIARIISEGQSVFRIDGFSIVYENGRPEWDKDIEELVAAAKKSKVNAARLDIINSIIARIKEQAGKRFEDLDSTVDSIADMALRNSDDIIYAVTAYNALDYFLDKHKGMISDRKYRKRASSNLDDYEDKLIDITKKRFEDPKLKNLIAEYKALFPDAVMLTDRTPPANIKEVQEVLKDCLAAYFMLDRVSAMTDFKKWGYCMLTLLIFDNNTILLDEYEQQLKNYRSTFK
ncbi:MAG: hypothetical protein IKB74_04900 [Lentisphaeria bacterium]|nr:hypothetical protein [Lentisphaeria bacterium]